MQSLINLQPDHLQNDLIVLKPLTGAEFEELYQVASDPLIWEVHPARDRYKREVFESFYADAVSSGTSFLVYDKISGDLIGSTRYYEYNLGASSVAIGYTFLARSFWGGHYNKAMKTLLLDYAFQFADTVFFHIGASNFRSLRAVEKLGGVKVREYINTSSATGSLYCEYKITKDLWSDHQERVIA